MKTKPGTESAPPISANLSNLHPSGMWRVLLLFFVPAVLIAVVIGALNLKAFYALQVDHHQSDASRIAMLQEVATLTEFNRRLSDIQLQVEELLTRRATGTVLPAELESLSREIGVRLTVMDWEFGNRFTSSGVTAEIHAALDAAEAQRQVMLEALEGVATDPAQTQTYVQAATEKQKLLTDASNSIIERVVNDLLNEWQSHNDEFETHSQTAILVGGLTILLVLILWLALIGWLGRGLLKLTGALQKLSRNPPELRGLESIESLLANPASLLRPMAESVVAFRDAIQARQQAEHELRKLSLVVEQNPNAVIVTDLDARIEYVNDAFVAMTGYERDWITGRNPRLLRTGKTPQATYAAMWRALMKGESWQGEFINRRRDGSELLERAIIMPLRQPSGEITHYVAIKRDITNRKRMEAELERYHAHLEQLVAERTRELHQAKVAAEMANQSKSEFLANVTHELLTPMNAIMGLTHLARQSAQDNGQQAQLEKVEGSARHLLSLINNLLDLSQIEAGQASPEPQAVNLKCLLQQVLDGIQPHLKQKSLSLEIDFDSVPENVLTDGEGLRKVLLNLTENAVKFTPQGEIQITARTVAQDGDHYRIRFSVSDTGIGISNKQMERLFQPFEQADNSTTRRFGGNGLGLAISKRIIERLGGEIGAESDPGTGSTFWFELPVYGAGAVSTHSEDIQCG